MIIVQHIETKWTKRSRGMPGAAARNAVPRVLALPGFPKTPAGIRVHKVMAHEDHAFDLHQRTEIIATGQDFTRYWTLQFVPAETAVLVSLKYSRDEHGLPPRREVRHPILQLAPGETGALHINGRFSYTSGQHYRQHFVNVAHADAWSPDLFMREADHFVDMTANLF
jgi:hypothetical protein